MQNHENPLASSIKHTPWNKSKLIGCRAQDLEPQCFRLTKGDGRLLLPEQDEGGTGASVVWMGDGGLFQVEGVVSGGELMSAAAAVGAAPSARTRPAQRCGQALLDLGLPVVRQLAALAADREARNRVEVAPSGMEGLLATAIKREGVTRPPPNCTGAAGSHPTYGSREPLVGSAKDPGGADQAWVQRLCPNGGQVYAAPAGQGAVSRLAYFYQAALLSNLGL